MSTNMTGLRCFSKAFVFVCMDESSLSIERVKLLSQLLYYTVWVFSG